MLKMTNVQYRYKESADEYDFTMQIAAGEIAAVLGKSGSGKSTLLDLAAGFLPVKSGHIYLDEQELTTLAVEKRPLTILFQHHNLFEHLSVEKNILLGINKKFKTTAAQQEQVSQILLEVGLQGFEKRVVSSLSGGQRQRVGLARALLRNHPILLLDEPFSGLDPQSRRQMLQLVEKISKEKQLHTVMVTHEKEDAQMIADKIYYMENHHLVLS